MTTKKQTKRMTKKKKQAKFSVKMTESLSPMALGTVAKPKRGKRAAATHATDVTSFGFQLGATARDIITGFEGVLTGRAQYLTGCTQYLVQPKGDENGVGGESRWLDEARLNVLISVPLVALNAAPNGGPQANEPPRA